MSFPQLWEEEHRVHRAWQESGFHGPRACSQPGSAPREEPACTGEIEARCRDAEEEQMMHTSA